MRDGCRLGIVLDPKVERITESVGIFAYASGQRQLSRYVEHVAVIDPKTCTTNAWVLKERGWFGATD